VRWTTDILEVIRVLPSDYCSGSVWDLRCEIPYCLMTKQHSLCDCPFVRTAVAALGQRSVPRGELVRLTSSIGWECLVCRCGEKALVEDALESGPFGPRCVHCLGICYCADRTFDKAKYIQAMDKLAAIDPSPSATHVCDATSAFTKLV
jgi:hypothetical protein